MRKLIQIITFALLYFGVKAQTFTPIHNYQAPDGLAIQKYAGIPHGDTATFTFPDSILINGIPTKTPNFLFQESDSTVYIHWGKWIAMKGSGGASLPFNADSIVVKVIQFPDSCGYWQFNWKGDTIHTYVISPCGTGIGQVNSDWDATSGVAQILNKPLFNNQITNGIIDPLLVTWSGTGLVYDVSAGSFIYKNVTHYVLATQVTLDAADGTYPRIDAFYVDTLGNIGKITGVAATNPVSPQVTYGQFLLTTAYVPAGATTPTDVNITTIYDENIEWTTSSSGTGTIDFNNTANPYHLTKAILVSSNSTGFTMTFTNPSGIDTAGIGDVFKFFIYTATNLPHGYTFQFFSGTNAVSTPLSIDQPGYGFNPNNYGTYQNVSIPLSAFTFFSPQFNSIKITSIGANGNPVYWDYIQIQKGLYQFAPTDYSNKVDSTTISGGNEYWWAKGSSHLAGSVGGGTYTASNGLTMSGNDVQLGGILNKSDTINVSGNGNSLIIYGDTSSTGIKFNSVLGGYGLNKPFSSFQQDKNFFNFNVSGTGTGNIYISHLSFDSSQTQMYHYSPGLQQAIFLKDSILLKTSNNTNGGITSLVIGYNKAKIKKIGASFDGLFHEIVTSVNGNYADSTGNIKSIDSTVTLSSGTITVSDTRIKTGAKIFLSINTPSGTQGFLSAKTSDIVNGTSFIINSTSATENSTVNYEIINP